MLVHGFLIARSLDFCGVMVATALAPCVNAQAMHSCICVSLSPWPSASLLVVG